MNLYPKLVRELRRKGVPVADVDDVLQEAALQVWSGRRRLPPDVPFEKAARMAVYGVLSNRARARRALKRGRGRIETSFDADSDSHEMFLADNRVESDPELRLQLAEYQRKLAAALAKLPKQMRMAVNGYYLRGQDLAEIAERLGVKPTSVRVYLFHARERIRRELDLEHSDDG